MIRKVENVQRITYTVSKEEVINTVIAKVKTAKGYSIHTDFKGVRRLDDGGMEFMYEYPVTKEETDDATDTDD